MDTDGETLREGKIAAAVKKLSSKELACLEFEDVMNEKNKNSIYFTYEFLVDEESVSEGTAIFVRVKHFDFKNPEIKMNVTESRDAFLIELNATSYAKYVEIDMEKADGIFEDNIFDMTPGKVKKVRLLKEDLSEPLTLEELKKQLRVRSLYDTYE